MSVFATITADLLQALKSREEAKVSTLRFLISNINNSKIAKGSELTDEEVTAEIAKDAKRHRESIGAFKAAGRDELAEKEQVELAILGTYLPEQMSDDEVAKIVEEAISQTNASTMADLGKVMGVVMGKVKGQADGTLVSKIVKEKLSD